MEDEKHSTKNYRVEHLWAKKHGWNAYMFKVVHIRSDLATMTFHGLQESGVRLTLSESGDEFTTDGHTIV